MNATTALWFSANPRRMNQLASRDDPELKPATIEVPTRAEVLGHDDWIEILELHAVLVAFRLSPPT